VEAALATAKPIKVIIGITLAGRIHRGKAYVGSGVPPHSPTARMPTIFEFINTTLGVQVPQELTGIGIGNLVAYALAACILFGFGTVLGVDIALFASGLTIMFLNLWMGHVTIVDSTVSSMLVMGGLYAIARKRGG